jgi:hypothetical protein
MKVIGIIGKKESGKTTLAYMMERRFTQLVTPNPGIVFIRGFGDALKEMIVRAGFCTKEEVFQTKTDFSRMIMQKIGTEIIRDQVDPSFWIKKMDEFVQSARQINHREVYIIIHDVRFMNEAEYIRSKGGILIKILRTSSFEDTHRSESEQDSINADQIILNDGSLSYLQTKAEKFVDDLLNE